MLRFLHPTPPLPDESVRARTLYSLAAVLVALALFVAAIGAGSPDTPPENKLPLWVDVAANVFSAGLGVLVLIPGTRAVGAILAMVSMVASMSANYAVDGPDFFVQALPFNLTTLVLAALVARRQLRRVT